MSFDLPASVERDLERYAQDEHISTAEAAVKLIQDALKSQKRKSTSGQLTEAEWTQLQEADPGFAFFAKMPDNAIDDIAAASKQARAERFTPRA